jgi:methyl-accepting chemotaxis protein
MVSSAVAGIAQAGQNSLDAVARSSGAAENLRRHASELERALAAFKVELAN